MASPPSLATLPSVAAEEQDAGPRVLIALCVASFLAALNFFAVTPFYPQITRDLDTTVPLLGQVATSIILISAGLGLVVGPLADRYGFRWPLVIGVLAIAVNLLGTGLAPSYPVLLLLTPIGGLGDAIVFGLPLALASVRFAGAAQRRAIGWTIGSLSGGAVIGIPILTAISAVASWRAALVVVGIGAGAAAWFVAASLPADGHRPPTRLRPGDLLAAYAPLLAHPPTLRLYGTSALRMVAWIGLLTYLGAFLGDVVGLGTGQIGLIYTVTGAGYAAGSFAAGGRLRLGPPRTTVAVSCLAGGLAVGLIILLASAWAAVPLLVAAGLASAFAGVGLTTLLANESPARAGTTMALNGSVLNLGSAVGTGLGGALIALGGYDALVLGLPLFALAAAALAWWPAGPPSEAHLESSREARVDARMEGGRHAAGREPAPDEA